MPDAPLRHPLDHLTAWPADAPDAVPPPAAHKPSLSPRVPAKGPQPMKLTHLQRLEAESIHIMREVVAETENPVMLYSVGKDSATMLHLAGKAFYPSPIPFPLPYPWRTLSVCTEPRLV